MADSTVETTNAKPQEDWMARRWRPMMGWMYMVVCTFDFVVAPVLWAFLQAKMGQPVTQWKPLTLEGAGLFHMAMGAVLGVAAYGRTQEKLGGANNGGLQVSQQPAPSLSAPAASFGTGSPSAATGAPGFGSSPASTANTSSVGSSAPAFGSATVTTSSGKPGPVQPDHPEI